MTQGGLGRETALSYFFESDQLYVHAALAVIVFRVLARRSPGWLRQIFLIVISFDFLSELTQFDRIWPLLAMYLTIALCFGEAIAVAAGRRRSVLVGAACTLALVNLAAFKYAKSFLSSDASSGMFRWPEGLHWIGLSYLTFKAIDYFVAIGSRSKAVVEVRPRAFYGLSYLIFFPAYVSGPINRFTPYAKDQAAPWRPLTFERFRANLLRIAVGVIKILFFGEWARAHSILTGEFQGSAPIGLASMILGLYAYYLYFYFNFSGYCDVAIALADFFEVQLPENFQYPFLARSPQDFWNRWHITLSQFVRDMVYFRLLRAIVKRAPAVPPVLGSMVSIFVTFTLVGVWHGDTFNWLLYGCYHGLALSTELAYRQLMETYYYEGYLKLLESRAYQVLCVIAMFHFIAFGLVLTLPLGRLQNLLDRLIGV
jgi:D-alanyl-lipoteichoic acid acyltransferase DltB (MBOAT superfamily)